MYIEHLKQNIFFLQEGINVIAKKFICVNTHTHTHVYINTYGHEFEQTQGGNKGQGSLACCNPWACKESDTPKQLNNIYESNWFSQGNRKKSAE